VEANGVIVQLTASIGVRLAHRVTAVDEAMNAADRATYQAKRGRAPASSWHELNPNARRTNTRPWPDSQRVTAQGPAQRRSQFRRSSAGAACGTQTVVQLLFAFLRTRAGQLTRMGGGDRGAGRRGRTHRWIPNILAYERYRSLG